MLKSLVSATCAAVIVMGSVSTVAALPMSGAAIPSPSRTESLLRDVRMFCYNRYSGRFLHWGGCASSYHPRVYCRSNYTGRFLHWGSCY